MIVLDASVAASWLLPDENSGGADAVLAMLATERARVPSLFWDEIRNILVMATRRGWLGAGEAEAAIARLRRLPIETVDMTPSGDVPTMRMAAEHRLTAYDATYLALAHGIDAPLATADLALARAAGVAGIRLLIAPDGG